MPIMHDGRKYYSKEEVDEIVRERLRGNKDRAAVWETRCREKERELDLMLTRAVAWGEQAAELVARMRTMQPIEPTESEIAS